MKEEYPIIDIRLTFVKKPTSGGIPAIEKNNKSSIVFLKESLLKYFKLLIVLRL